MYWEVAKCTHEHSLASFCTEIFLYLPVAGINQLGVRFSYTGKYNGAGLFVEKWRPMSISLWPRCTVTLVYCRRALLRHSKMQPKMKHHHHLWEIQNYVLPEKMEYLIRWSLGHLTLVWNSSLSRNHWLTHAGKWTTIIPEVQALTQHICKVKTSFLKFWVCHIHMQFILFDSAVIIVDYIELNMHPL